MGLARYRLAAVLVCAAAFLVVATGGDALAAKRPTAKSALKTLVRQTAKLPDSAAPAGKRRALRRLAVHARKSARRKPCASVHDLNVYRRVLGGVRVKKKKSRATRRLAVLGPSSLDASRLLLASKRTKRCGGGASARRGDNPKTRVMKSSGRRLRVKVQMPQVGFGSRQGGGKTWTELGLANSDSPGAPGTPGIPVVSDMLAIPDGAKVKVHVNDVDKVALDGVDLYPVQSDPVDADSPPPDFFSGPFADAPFKLNKSAYDKNKPFPAKPADADSLGQMRDINVGALQLPTAQYNPVKKKLSLITSIDVTLKFAGGPHTFTSELGDPWEHFQHQMAATFLNAGLLRGSRLVEILRRCGEEMLVVTNPATLDAAKSFASARSAAGIRTRVVQTGSGTGFIGTTPTDIQTYIRGELTRLLCIHPSYVTIFGDDDLVPTFTDFGSIPSDLKYSMKDDADELPDVAVGRIIGNDQNAVQTVVDKIVSYENSPPSGPWLHRATVAAQFQDDNADGQEERTFVQFAETVRTGLVGHHETVDRVYADAPSTTPSKFNDGTALPAELQKPTFAWTGSGADVTAAWNAGRFLMVHRDHGYSDGWGTPGYSTSDAQGLTNGAQLPVLLSINCSSAAYDYDETSFVGESLVNPNGGAVGAFGDTRDSPTWHNSQLALGFADGLLPFVLPSEGTNVRMRTGNALINGKLRLAGLAPPSGDGNTRNELYLWHYFGDPTMQMWGARDRFVVDLSKISAVFTRAVQDPPPDPPPYWVVVALPPGLNGETISILRNGDILGKAIVQGDSARIPASLADSSRPSGQLQVALEPDGSTPIQVDVKDEEPRGKTSISGDCSGGAGTNDPMFMAGTLSGAPPGSTVTVTYEHPSSQTSHTETTTTDAKGHYQTSYVGNRAGTWLITAHYAGTDQYEPSDSTTCQISSG